MASRGGARATSGEYEHEHEHERRARAESTSTSTSGEDEDGGKCLRRGNIPSSQGASPVRRAGRGGREFRDNDVIPPVVRAAEPG